MPPAPACGAGGRGGTDRLGSARHGDRHPARRARRRRRGRGGAFVGLRSPGRHRPRTTALGASGAARRRWWSKSHRRRRSSTEVAEAEAPPAPAVRPSFRDRLAKARGTLGGYLGSIRSRKVDAETWDELEEALIRADVGVGLHPADPRRAAHDGQGRVDHRPRGAARPAQVPAQGPAGDRRPHAAPRARHARTSGCSWASTAWARPPPSARSPASSIDAGRSVVMAAGDTFRAAAAEQLGMWAERTGAEHRARQRGRRPVGRSSSTRSSGRRPGATTSCWPTPPAACTPRPT